jgi:hypothetical protein
VIVVLRLRHQRRGLRQRCTDVGGLSYLEAAARRELDCEWGSGLDRDSLLPVHI